VQQVALSNVSGDDVELWVRSRWLSAEMEKALREIVAAKAELADLERQLQATDAELQRLAQDQERLRKNLGALGSSTAEQQLRGRYVDQLQKSEDRVAEQTAARQKLAERRDEKRKALERRIAELAL
jgi:flagellar biosynthesis chaperone FliJ